MMASNAECLPMAQLFANLSPSLTLLPQLAFGAPSLDYPHPLSLAAKKQQRSNLALSFLLPRPIGAM